MLVAYNEKKQAIILFQLLLQKSLQEIKAQQYYCPQCGEPVIIKAGAIKIPHFSHKHKSACDGLFSERESVVHLTGKQHLYTWLHSKNVDVRLEATIPRLLQRPDILAIVRKKRYAIEFQCSPIGERLFYKRTAGYKSIGIEPIWILTDFMPNTMRPTSFQAIKLTHFQRLFIKRGGSLPFIVCFNVDRQQFIYYHHLFFVRSNECVAAVSTLPLKAQHLPLLQPSSIPKKVFQQIFGLFRNRQRAYISASYSFGQAKVHDLLWRSMYELRILYDQIPFTVGIPIVNSEYVCESTLKWQVALHYYVKSFQIPLLDMQSADVQRFLRWANFSMVPEAQCAVLHYITICKQVGIETVHSAVSVQQLIDCLYSQFVALSVKN